MEKDIQKLELARKFLEDGDRESFTKLFLIYADKIFGIARHFNASSEEAEEIVQEVFLKIWLKRKSILRPESLSSFIYKTSKNLIYDTHRKNLQKKAYSEFLQSQTGVNTTLNTEEAIFFNDLEKVYTELVKDLPEKQRQVFLLSRYNGYTNKKIAEEMNISVRTVEEHIRQALKSIKETLRTKYDIAVCLAAIFMSFL